MKVPMFQLNVETRMLADRLMKCEIGATVNYSDLTAACGRDVQHDGCGTLASARRICERDHRAVFDVIRGVGLVRMTGAQVVSQTTERPLERIRRLSRRAIRRLSSVEYEELPPEVQRKHNVGMGMYGALGLVASHASVQKVEKAIEGAPSQAALPPRKLLDLFRSGEK